MFNMRCPICSTRMENTYTHVLNYIAAEEIYKCSECHTTFEYMYGNERYMKGKRTLHKYNIWFYKLLYKFTKFTKVFRRCINE